MSYLRMLAWGMIEGTPEMLPMVNEELRETDVQIGYAGDDDDHPYKIQWEDPHLPRDLGQWTGAHKYTRHAYSLEQACRFSLQYWYGDPVCTSDDIEWLCVKLMLSQRWGDALHNPSTVAHHHSPPAVVHLEAAGEDR